MKTQILVKMDRFQKNRGDINIFFPLSYMFYLLMGDYPGFQCYDFIPHLLLF